jgi:Synergist-CTERM protein sorting domain-containing protein
MLVADGGAGTVSIYRNTSGTPGDARDPPDSPAVSVYSWSLRARSVPAPGSAYGGTADWFVDFAYSWSDLAAVGIGPATPVRVWAATSSTATTGMTGDFACRNGGAPTLDGAWPGTAADPGHDGDGDGFSDATEIQNGTDPNDGNSHPSGAGDVPRLAGGGGCQHGAAALPALAAVVPMLLLRRRRSPRAPSTSTPSSSDVPSRS